MAQGFEVDWDELAAAASRLLRFAGVVGEGRGRALPGTRDYGHRGLAAAARDLLDAWFWHEEGLRTALDGLGEGAKASARSYREADVDAAARRFRMHAQ